MSKKIHILRFCVVFAGALSCLSVCQSAEQSDRVRRVENGGASTHYSTLEVNPKARKVYAGQAAGYDPTSGGLCVFDIDAQGEVTGSDERVYPVIPAGEENLSATIVCIRLSPDGRKLFVARDYLSGKVQTTLIVYDLNEKGEPTGKPRGFKSGNPFFIIWDMVVDPKSTYLYTVGYGGAAVYGLPLRKGEPTGEPVAFNVAGTGKFSIVPTEKWDSFLLGTYPSLVEVVNLNAANEVDSPLPGSSYAFKASDALIYLPLARVGRCLYFVINEKLWSWPLDSEWQPIEQPHPHPEVKASFILTGAHETLYVLLDASEKDASGKNVVSNNFRVAQFKPDAKGNPGKAVYESQILEHQGATCIAVNETTGFIYLVTCRR